MKSVVISNIKNTDINFEYKNSFYLNNNRIQIGIVNQDPPVFNKNYLKDYLLIKKQAFSCNYRDKAVAVFNTSNIQSKSVKQLNAYYPIGSDFVATALKLGSNVKDFKKGDKVIPIGQYPEPLSKGLNPGLPTNFASQRYQIFHKSQLLKVPESIPDEMAACITVSGHTVYSMIEKASLKKTDKILITSLKSNTSIALATALNNRGYEIWGLTTSGEYKQRFEGLGISKVIVHNGVENLIEIDEIGKLKNKIGGFDVVFDPFVDLHFSRLISCLSTNAKYLTCGIFAQLGSLEVLVKHQMSLPHIMFEIITKNISIIGNCLGHKRHLDHAIQEFVNGNFKIPIDSVFTGNDIDNFFNRTFNDPDRFGKVVYKYDD